MVRTTEQYDTILNTRPCLFPTPVFMDDQSMDEHIQAGHDVGVSERLYNVDKCDWYGVV